MSQLSGKMDLFLPLCCLCPCLHCGSDTINKDRSESARVWLDDAESFPSYEFHCKWR
ncbi:hypothetical protein GIB67_011401 [Kingdonia uniflora]|uniref:Uncharacterized protein n=1 Tax=Kingdonia uniflora TaxID=39325 RepID=A0A7J7NLL1_9MAGN|nr:hypothetical protein GIB67_011401 [Kingdonia uniflora]